MSFSIANDSVRRPILTLYFLLRKFYKTPRFHDRRMGTAMETIFLVSTRTHIRKILLIGLTKRVDLHHGTTLYLTRNSADVTTKPSANFTIRYTFLDVSSYLSSFYFS